MPPPPTPHPIHRLQDPRHFQFGVSGACLVEAWCRLNKTFYTTIYWSVTWISCPNFFSKTPKQHGRDTVLTFMSHLPHNWVYSILVILVNSPKIPETRQNFICFGTFSFDPRVDPVACSIIMSKIHQNTNPHLPIVAE